DVADFDLHEAADGLQALEVAAQQEPTLVFLDVDMPGLNGIEACRALRQQDATSHATIVMLTAAHGNEVEHQAEAAGADLFLTTPRAAATAPELAERAAAVHHMPAGRVDELAAELRPQVQGEVLVALGGGRVIDTAKALAAADPPRRVAAIPTTLSGAEMTPVHRRAADADPSTPGVRPWLVINDPALSASQPEAELAQSAG